MKSISQYGATPNAVALWNKKTQEFVVATYTRCKVDPKAAGVE